MVEVMLGLEVVFLPDVGSVLFSETTWEGEEQRISTTR